MGLPGWLRVLISIHALLAESDFIGPLIFNVQPHFYPRSPCGERHGGALSSCFAKITFLSTLSLRRATTGLTPPPFWASHFYPRSPCGERPFTMITITCTVSFLSTLSLRRATDTPVCKLSKSGISIHALLAESDKAQDEYKDTVAEFLSTLSLRRATCGPHSPLIRQKHFYPRSPCGERLQRPRFIRHGVNFYPRSPCGERLSKKYLVILGRVISIHALLAESDSVSSVINNVVNDFYPRSPCGERPIPCSRHISEPNFYPRSPCGERR